MTNFIEAYYLRQKTTTAGIRQKTTTAGIGDHGLVHDFMLKNELWYWKGEIRIWNLQKKEAVLSSYPKVVNSRPVLEKYIFVRLRNDIILSRKKKVNRLHVLYYFMSYKRNQAQGKIIISQQINNKWFTKNYLVVIKTS